MAWRQRPRNTRSDPCAGTTRHREGKCGCDAMSDIRETGPSSPLPPTTGCPTTPHRGSIGVKSPCDAPKESSISIPNTGSHRPHTQARASCNHTAHLTVQARSRPDGDIILCTHPSGLRPSSHVLSKQRGARLSPRQSCSPLCLSQSSAYISVSLWLTLPALTRLLPKV